MAGDRANRGIRAPKDYKDKETHAKTKIFPFFIFFEKFLVLENVFYMKLGT